jgi:hypothetical protein
LFDENLRFIDLVRVLLSEEIDYFRDFFLDEDLDFFLFSFGSCFSI